jgi:hypothetical protein
VQPVDVLRRDHGRAARRDEAGGVVGDRAVRGVRHARGDERAAPGVPFPHQPRVAPEPLGRGQLLGAERSPQAVGTAEGRHAGLGAHSRAREDHEPARVGQQRPGLIKRGIGRMVGHAAR